MRILENAKFKQKNIRNVQSDNIVGHKMISQLEAELEKKELEFIQEEKKLNQLNEKYSMLKLADKNVNVLQRGVRYEGGNR